MTTRAQIHPRKPESPLVCDPAAPLETARTLLRANKIPRELLTDHEQWLLNGGIPWYPLSQLHAVLWLVLNETVRPNGKPFQPRKSHVKRVLEAIDALLEAKSYYACEEPLPRVRSSGRAR